MIVCMNAYASLAYLEVEGKTYPIPFERYLPPQTPGLLPAWLKRNFTDGANVLEPIGASPAAILEMASAGYLVLTAVNNPVTAFELAMLARAPSKEEFKSVLRELAMQKKGEERLGTHLQNFYMTRCASCGREIQADAYLWRRGESAPYAKLYRCPACGDEGERPTIDLDLEKLTACTRSDGLHRARALERVPGGTREARENLEEILKIYPARPLYVLFTLINKLEGMSLSPQKRALADALLLSTLDAGHCLWPLEEKIDRPRLLNIPQTYVEKNLWTALEDAVDTWCVNEKAIPLTQYPELPRGEHGICLYQGRMRDLEQKKPTQPLQTFVCVLPRPNQAFWTLSTLWSSWLWGKENAASLKNVLERQRFDWYWHANALQSALACAGRMLPSGGKAFSLIPEPVAGFVAAAVEANCASNLKLSGLAWKDEVHPVQSEWLVRPSGNEVKKVNLRRIIREAIHDCLSESGEPSRYLKLYTAVIAALADQNAFPTAIQQLTYETVTEIHGEIGKVFADRKFLRRMENTAQEPESGSWWLEEPEGCQASLADRVETEIVQWLQKEPKLPSAGIQKMMNARFPGFLTPPEELVEQCLLSYADLDAAGQTWNLKPNENAKGRDHDLVKIQTLLGDLAKKMEVKVEGENPLKWKAPDQAEKTIYRLFLSTSALLSWCFKDEDNEETENVFLFPGSRSALLHYKMERDPWLRERVSQGWHFLKYRALRELASRSDISLDLWDLFIDSDPISQEDATQLSMFL